MKHSTIEPLEARIAPAMLLNSTTVIFHDLDGDDVTVKFSKPILNSPVTAALLLKFDTGSVHDDATDDGPQQLQLIDLQSQVATTVNGVSFSVTAKRSATRGGDGFADVGFVNAMGLDLGVVQIAGDLGRIIAGNTTTTSAPAVKSLTVQSMGELGISTQQAGGSLASSLDGGLSTLVVKGSLRDVSIAVTGAAEGTIGSATIGGTIFGGVITTTGDFGSVKIGGSLLGGAMDHSGRIVSGGALGSVTIGGAVEGTGADTGIVSAATTMNSVKIGGDLRGGAGASSGRVSTNTGDISNITIGGSIAGGAGQSSGAIEAGHGLGKVSVGQDVRGGAGSDSGTIYSDGDISSVAIKGSLVGAAGVGSASIVADNAIGSVKIGGSVRGGVGSESGVISSDDHIDSLAIGGSLAGYIGALGMGGANGEGGATILSGMIKSVSVGKSVYGGIGDDSGVIRGSFDGLGKVAIGGSLVGGEGSGTASILGDQIDSVSIGGDVRGGAGSDSGTLSASGGDQIGKVSVGGSVFSGTGNGSGWILGYTGLPSVTIKGSLVGTAANPVVISSNYDYGDANHDIPTIGKMTVGGRVEFAQILAGYSGTTPISADSKIGSITVGGDWIASSIAAGVRVGTDGKFGTADDARNPLNSPPPSGTNHPEFFKSSIGSVTIKGQLLGTPTDVSGADAFGFVAESIGSIRIGTTKASLTSAVDAVPLGATGDFIAREDVGGPQIMLPVLIGGVDVSGSGKAFTFTDVDGDLVTVKTNKAVLDAADFITVPSGSGYQLQEIRVSNHGDAARGLSITVSAKPQDLNDDGVLDGDGSVNIGYINSLGVDLGAVKIAGDLGRIEVGDMMLSNGSLKSLSVQSMGVFALSTQAAGGNLRSDFSGKVGAIGVRGDILDAVLEVSATQTWLGPGDASASGDIGKLTIGGSLRAGADNLNDVEGGVFASGKIGSVKVGRDIIGGAGEGSGQIFAGDKIGSVKIGGSIVGGALDDSGLIESEVGIGSVTVVGDLIGAAGEYSGAISGTLSLGSVKIGGSMLGGSGEESGGVSAEDREGVIKSVTVGGDVIGGGGERSSYIHAGNKLGVVKIGGSLVGGVGLTSAVIYAGTAFAEPHFIKSVSIGGDVIGAVGQNSANLGSAFSSVGAASFLDIGNIAVRGSIVGGAGFGSGSITAGNVPKIAIGGSVIGAVGNSAEILVTGTAGSITIGGSLIGGAAPGSGYLSAQKLGKLAIKGDLRGGGSDFAGYIFANLDGAKSISIGRSIVSGNAAKTGAIDVNGPLGSLGIGGDVIGTAANPVNISARGTDSQTKPLAIGNLTIKGSVAYLNILGGFAGFSAQALNADANLGKISVGGSWTAGNISAGVDRGGDGSFGTNQDKRGAFGNDADKYSKIASITIKGRAMGTIDTVSGTDHFGFVADEIVSVKIGAVKFPLVKNAGNDNENRMDAALLEIGPTGDFSVREVPIVI